MDTVSSNTRKTLNCRHRFHRKCINTWLAENNTCPLCRKDQTNHEHTAYNEIISRNEIIRLPRTLF